MYIGVDIGGTKVLVGVFTDAGKLEHSYKFPTPKDYADLISELETFVAKLTMNNLKGAAVALPAVIDQARGTGKVFGNLAWRNVPILADAQRIFKCPVRIANDANAAGLAEAVPFKGIHDKVLYVTVSTGIGTGIVVRQEIDSDFADAEGGHLLLEHEGTLQYWETFASGRAIVKRFGCQAKDIHDTAAWDIIAQNLAKGLVNLCAILQPDVIVIGGGVGNYFERFEQPLLAHVRQISTSPLVAIPLIVKAKNPDEAVIYGCYELAKRCYAEDTSTTTS